MQRSQVWLDLGFQRKPQHWSTKECCEDSDTQQHIFKYIFNAGAKVTAAEWQSLRKWLFKREHKKIACIKFEKWNSKDQVQHKRKAVAENLTHVQEPCWINVTGVFHLAACWISARTFRKVSWWWFSSDLCVLRGDACLASTDYCSHSETN